MKVAIIVLFSIVVATAAKYGSLTAKKTQKGSRLDIGQPAEIGQFPFTVGLRNDDGFPMCGAAIISSKHIITEAWCIGAVPSMTIIAGCLNFLGTDCEEYQFENLWVHPNSSGLAENDIAIVSIQGEFALSDAVQIIPLAQETVPDGSNATIVGWSTNELLWLDVVVETCTSWGDPTVICTAPSVVGGGDYGCPLIVDGTLAGIPVLGSSQDIHQRISPFVEWINSVITA